MIRIFRVFIPASVLALLISECVLILACYTAAAYVEGGDLQFYLITEGNWVKVLIVVGVVMAGLYFQDLYTDLRIPSRLVLLQQVCLAVGCSLLFMAFLGYLKRDYILGRWMMVIGSIATIIVLPSWRVFFWRYIIVALRSERVLLMGNSSILAEVIDCLIAKPEFGYSIVGYLCEVEPCDFPIPCLGNMNDVQRVCAEYRPTRIVVGMAERRNRLPVQDLLEIRFAGTIIEDAADTYEMAMRRVCSRKIQPSQLIFSSMLGPKPQAITIQNFYSLLIGFIGLIVGSPLMLITAVLVRVSSKGPILYRQQRVGLNGEIFTLYKFRSMYADAEARTGAVWAKVDDPRITPVGRWLRRLRLDELPQLWNVVRGQMAIVGPRPERPEFVELLTQQIPYYRQRLAVKPGITGWAQINHKYGDTALDAMIKLEYDLYYIKHVAPMLDFYIIFHTLKVMLLGSGAQ